MRTETSEAQSDAARRNGARSAGPTTEEGKARASQNATRHGLNSRTVVLANESQEAYDELLATYREEWQPEGQIENDLVTEMVNARWRLRRIWAMETAALDSEMFIQRSAFDASFSVTTPAMRQADAFLSLARNNAASLDHLHRYEIRYSRIHERAMKSLVFLQKQRGVEPPAQNEPEPNTVPSPHAAVLLLLNLLTLLIQLLKPAPTPRRRVTRHQACPRPETPGNAVTPEAFHWDSTYSRKAD